MVGSGRAWSALPLVLCGCLLVASHAAAQRSTPVTVINDDSVPVPVRNMDVIAMASPRSGVAPLNVQFRAEVVGGDAPLSYSWDFGDGGISDLPAEPHLYCCAGEYRVLVVVTDAQGAQRASFVDIAVGADSVPTVAVSAEPAGGVVPLEVRFRADTAGGNAPLTIAWSIDGGPVAALGPVFEHVFLSPALSEVTVHVVDADGDEVVASELVDVQQDLPVSVSAAALPSAGNAPLPVSFTCAVVGGNAPLTFVWEFGNGAASGTQNPSLTYTSPGLFVARCTVTDADGDIGAGSAVIQALEPTP